MWLYYCGNAVTMAALQFNNLHLNKKAIVNIFKIRYRKMVDLNYLVKNEQNNHRNEGEERVQRIHSDTGLSEVALQGLNIWLTLQSAPEPSQQYFVHLPLYLTAEHSSLCSLMQQSCCFRLKTWFFMLSKFFHSLLLIWKASFHKCGISYCPVLINWLLCYSGATCEAQSLFFSFIIKPFPPLKPTWVDWSWKALHPKTPRWKVKVFWLQRLHKFADSGVSSSIFFAGLTAGLLLASWIGQCSLLGLEPLFVLSGMDTKVAKAEEENELATCVYVECLTKMMSLWLCQS